jgi:hypothetical protein
MRNATCMNCGTRIDMDLISFCPYCEAERTRVRGRLPEARPLTDFFGITGHGTRRMLLGILTLLVVLGVIFVVISLLA